MVKTRKSTKRIIEKPQENEPPDIEEKRPRLSSNNKSKYFENKVNDNPHSEISINMDSGISTQNSSRNNSLNSSNLKSGSIIKAELDSDDSSSDEFLKVPFSLDDLGEFETLKKETTKPDFEDFKVESIAVESRLSDNSDDNSQQEYYDFSQIIKTQELIIHTKKEQEAKTKNAENEKKGTKSKSQSARSSKSKKTPQKHTIKALGEELGISELLAITEGPESKEGIAHSSDSEEDNQEVKSTEEYSIPKEGVQITVELPNIKQKKKTKGFDMEAAVKRRINLIRKENQVFMHKVHVLCWIAHGNYLNHIINNDIVMGLALSLIPSAYCYPPKHADLNYLQKLVEWFIKKVLVNEKHKPSVNNSKLPLLELLEMQINCRVAFSQRDLVLIFVSMVRSLGINARLVINLRAVPLRPPASDLCQLSNKPKVEENKCTEKETSSKTNKHTKESNAQVKNKLTKEGHGSAKKKINKPGVNKENNDSKSPYFSSSDDIPLNKLLVDKKSAQPKNSGQKSETNLQKETKYFRKPRNSIPKVFLEQEKSSSEDDVDVHVKKRQIKGKKNINVSKRSKTKLELNHSDEDIFVPPKPSTSKKKSIDRRVLSSDDDSVAKKERNDYWIEVYLESEEKWINIDLRNGKVLCTELLYRGATQPVRYVVAWNNDGSAKDVTRRYAPQWLTVTRRLRAEDVWWRQTMAPYTPLPSRREKDEDEDLDKQIHDKPLPSSISDYKNHPLFALKRHLLKFQAIYPSNAPPLGFIRGEPVYSRGCVAELHTREAWIKEAKLVRRGEEPYKIVKARPKWDKVSQTVINDLPLPLFGFWQVEDYIPPPAVDGKVPRNEYGNVELYKPCMLPAGTVHLQVPQLARVARKLEIDCAPAVVGWEFSGGGSHPILDGFIVCEEFKEVLLDVWNKEMDESAKRAKERVEQRVYGNWKRLIKGLLIKERLKARYDFGDNVTEKKTKNKLPKGSTSKS